MQILWLINIVLQLYIAGPDKTTSNNPNEKLGKTTYVRYITELIKELNIGKHVVFTSFLDEGEMCERLLKSNIFVCPSLIEKSPNSSKELIAGKTENSRKRALKNHDEERYIDRLISNYNQILHREKIEQVRL